MVRGGASLVEREPVFSSDGKRLLVCTACSVSVYSVATGLLVTQLHGHTGRVSGIVVVPAVSLSHAWTSSQDGTIRMWDYGTGSLLRTVNVGLPICSMVIPDLCKPGTAGKTDAKFKGMVAYLSVSWTKEQEQKNDWNGRVVCHNLTTGKSLPGHLAKTYSTHRLYVSPAGGLVGMLDMRKVWMWRVPQGAFEGVHHVQSTILHHTRTLSVLAFDITETRVAGGDQSGRILIWENVGERLFATNSAVKDKSPNKKLHPAQKNLPQDLESRGGVRGDDDAGALTTYHWHAHEVKFLIFSSDGAYLLSGGSEGVLVIWQLETGKRQFLPRLGGPLVSIASSPKPFVFAVTCMDNTLKFVNIGTMEIERNIQGIKPPFLLPKQSTLHATRACIEPQEGKIVLPTHNLSLQFYDAASDLHVTEIQVAPRNYISTGGRNERDGGPSTFVTHVEFSADGTSMATVDVRVSEQEVGGGACLKYWDREPGKLQFSVNTQVDEVHEISALTFHPQELMTVSCSHTDFKVWVPNGSRRNSGFSWRCRSIGSYRQKLILAAAFSSDGTILAVAASELLTLWNPVTNTLIRVLANPTLSFEPISLLSFVNHSTCLVAASSGDQPRVTLWDLSTLSVCWSHSLSVEAIAVDPTRPNFAVLAGLPSVLKDEGVGSKNAVVTLFGVDSPAPLRYWTIRDGVGGVVLFFPDSQSSSQAPASILADDSKIGELNLATTTIKSSMAVITKGREFTLFNPYGEEEEPEKLLRRGSEMSESTARSAFTAMYGKTVAPKKEEVPSALLSSLGKAPWGTLLEGPSHVLPSLTLLCIPFMESLLKKRTDAS